MTQASFSSEQSFPARREADARVGMMIFLASWGMVFLTLFFAASVLRFRTVSWPPADAPSLPTLARIGSWANCIILIASSVLLSIAVKRSVKATPGERSSASLQFGAVLLLGAAFFAIQIFMWIESAKAGIRLSGDNYSALFYVLTTFHALHVLAGLGLLIWALPSFTRMTKAESSTKDRIRVHSASAFWHFVDIAWLATFAVVFA